MEGVKRLPVLSKESKEFIATVVAVVIAYGLIKELIK